MNDCTQTVVAGRNRRRPAVFRAWPRWAALFAGLLGWTLAGCEAMRYRDQIRANLFTPSEGERARLEVHDRVPVLHLYGTPEEMGRQYGQLLASALEGLSGYARCMLSAGQLERFLEYGRQHEQHLPAAIREQLRAMARTGGIDYDALVALNVTPRLRCSTLAVWGPSTPDGRMLMGRNGDYSSMGLDDCGNLVVVYHPASGQATALISFLGMAGGFAGMNADGVSFGNMLVFNAPGRREDGLPVQLAMRQAAESAENARQMADGLADMAHVIPGNVMIADAAEALVVELGPGGVHARTGADGVLAASNYFRAHPDRSADRRCSRYDTLVRAARDHRSDMTVERMKSALYDARMLNINIQATVFEPADRRMHVSINRNPASKGPYVVLEVGRLVAE